MALQLSDFDFELPPELIAQRPLARRSASRLLDCRAAKLLDRQFCDLPQLLGRGDLLIMNDTRVLKARLSGTKSSGGRIEFLVERIVDASSVLAHWRASHAPAVGSRVTLSEGTAARIEARDRELVTLRFEEPAARILERIGQLPLPPYIEHAPTSEDEERYQTVYARVAGAVAAPTAGLHFDEKLLAQIEQSGIGLATLTLHVGAGTFLPIRSGKLEDHVMHAERFSIPSGLGERIEQTRAQGHRVVAVGTTTLRALEAATSESGLLREGSDETRLFITPGYRFRCADHLITNFHLPQSTLLMLVAAFAGLERIRVGYAHAIAARYRFFSYGDAMLLGRA